MEGSDCCKIWYEGSVVDNKGEQWDLVLERSYCKEGKWQKGGFLDVQMVWTGHIKPKVS